MCHIVLCIRWFGHLYVKSFSQQLLYYVILAKRHLYYTKKATFSQGIGANPLFAAYKGWANRLIATNSNNYCLGALILVWEINVTLSGQGAASLCFAGPIQDRFTYLSLFHEKANLAFQGPLYVNLEHFMLKRTFHAKKNISCDKSSTFVNLHLHVTCLTYCWHFLFDITFHIKITNKTRNMAHNLMYDQHFTDNLKFHLFWHWTLCITGKIQENPQYAGILSRYL